MTTSVCGPCADVPSGVTVCGGLCGATVGVAGRPGPGPGEAFPLFTPGKDASLKGLNAHSYCSWHFCFCISLDP